MANSVGIWALVLSCITFALAIVETAIPYWVYGSVGNRWHSFGLWMECGSNGLGGSSCLSFSQASVWLNAVRAMEILGLLKIGAAGLCGFLKLSVRKEQNMLPKLSAALSMAAGAFMLIGAIIFAAIFNSAGTASHLYVAFGLAIVAAVLAFVTGIVFIILANKHPLHVHDRPPL